MTTTVGFLYPGHSAEDDFPRTHTLKVKKRLVLAALDVAETPAPTAADRAAATPPPAAAVGIDALRGLVAVTASVPVETVAAESRLSSDLGLDSLARVELQAAFGALLDRTSSLELGGEPVRRPEFVIRGLASLPVVMRA